MKARGVFDRTKSSNQQELRDRQKAWLAAAQTASGVSMTELARRANLHPGTLNRFMNDDGRAQLLSVQTIANVAESAEYAVPPHVLGAEPATGFREPDAAPYETGGNDPLKAAIDALCTTPNRFSYEVRSDALVHEGVRPGDIVIIDMAETPDAGEIACAQFYARSPQERTETVLRILSGRYLLAAGPMAANREPRPRDDASVQVMGTVIATLRRR